MTIILSVVSGVMLVIAVIVCVVYIKRHSRERQKQQGVRTWKVTVKDLQQHAENDLYGLEVNAEEIPWLNELVSRFGVLEISEDKYGNRMFR